MATLDQLPPDQRAIIELVLRRGKSYDDLSGMLGMRPSRVRELAREALGALTPTTITRVDSEWRGQLADYVLRQQSGPESTATRGHLRRSEPARAWMLSVLDSLDEWFAGDFPAVPEGSGSGSSTRTRPGATALEERPVRRRLRPEKPEGEERPRRPRRGAPTAEKPKDEDEATTLSPSAQAAVRRRRILGASALAALVAVVLLSVLLLSGGDDSPEESDSAGETTGQQQEPTTAAQPQPLAQAALAPVEEGQGQGVAVIVEENGQRGAVLQATGLKPTGPTEAYETWLYNSDEEAVSLGGQQTDQQGNYQGTAAPLPENYENYKFIDVSLETTEDEDPAHSGKSIIRGELGAPQQGQGDQPPAGP